MLMKTLLLASTATATCLHGLTKFKRSINDADPVEAFKFGYTGLMGPHNWAALAPENEACKTGKQQSPINIDCKDGTIKHAADKPVVDIPLQAMILENLGTTIEVTVNGTTKFGGMDYRLKQFHMHTPSEHRISEEYYPLELHFVHEGVSDPNALAVIALMFDLSVSPPSPIVAGLLPYLASVAAPHTNTTIPSGLDLSSLNSHIQSSDVYQYSGSLTTPPCAEGVTFLLARNPLPMDIASFNAIKKIIRFNSRFTQNVIGGMNMVEVGMMAGTEKQMMPESLAGGKKGNETKA